MKTMKTLSRRTLLRSGTATLLLPILQSNVVAKAAASSALPKRLVFLPMGYGVYPDAWFPNPAQTGTDWDVPDSLKPFEKQGLKSDISVIQNLTNRYYVNGHTGSTTFLTSANPRAVAGVSFSNTVSCDQVAAELLGRDTRHTSLAIGFEGKRADGHGGGSYQYASWGRNGKPVGVYQKLTDLYTALFGAKGVSKEQMRAQLARKQSSLDALVQNAKGSTTRSARPIATASTSISPPSDRSKPASVRPGTGSIAPIPRRPSNCPRTGRRRPLRSKCA